MTKSTLVIAGLLGLGLYYYYKTNKKIEELKDSTIKKVGFSSEEENVNSKMYKNGVYLGSPTIMNMV